MSDDRLTGYDASRGYAHTRDSEAEWTLKDRF
jgi:hypothetical protein